MNCSYCEDFHWVPEGAEPGWYTRDWRLLLDPTVRWQPCPHCRGQTSPVRALERTVSLMLLRRLQRDVRSWTEAGPWRQGRMSDGQRVFAQGEVYCLPPGPLLDAAHWTLISDMGILRELDRARCDWHLQRAHLHVLPDVD